jgi:hypothetical protein
MYMDAFSQEFPDAPQAPPSPVHTHVPHASLASIDTLSQGISGSSYLNEEYDALWAEMGLDGKVSDKNDARFAAIGVDGELLPTSPIPLEGEKNDAYSDSTIAKMEVFPDTPLPTEALPLEKLGVEETVPEGNKEPPAPRRCSARLAKRHRTHVG